MKEPEIIAANQTHQLRNHGWESFEDKAFASESWGRTETQASNRAIVIGNELCSIVSAPTRTWFRWID